MSPTAIALNRFGLGALPLEAPPQDARRWLLDQFARYEARPGAWAAHPPTPELLVDYQEQRRMVREAGEGNRQTARRALRRDARTSYIDAVGARTNTALQAQAPFVERLVHFWANHFAVSIEKPVVLNLAGAMELEAIRPHVLGRFEDMLLAVLQHPAMLAYLDQVNSIGPESIVGRGAAMRRPELRRGLNENLAREVLELHTLGVRSGYAQSDVTELARALTGWGVPTYEESADGTPRVPASAFQFRPGIHEPGTRTLLGKSYTQPGEAQARAILHDLVLHPSTARHVATKLARHFVADEPPASLVQRLADAFQRSGGDLAVVSRALVEAPEAWTAQAAKFKSPWDWSVSALRALGVREVPAPRAAGLLAELGQPVWRPGSPAGYDDLQATWAAPDALVRRVEAAQRLAERVPAGVDARQLAPRVLPGALGDASLQAIARAESNTTAVALLLVTPEFLRR